MSRAAAAALALALVGPAQAADNAPAVTVVAAAQGTVTETLPLTGTVVAREDVLVGAQVDGLAITEIHAEEGDLVAANQVLARLSRDTVDASLAQNAAQIARAEASIAQARASQSQADAAFARTRDLITTGAASRETFDQRQMAAQTAAATLQSVQADLTLAQAQRQELLVRLAHTDIRAPVAGRVSRRVARLGSVVSLSGEPLFRLMADDAVELEADVPETVLARLRPGQSAQVTLAGETASRTGAVRLVAPELSRSTRLGRVRLSIPGAATIGGFARAVVETGRRQGVVVPLSAVLFQPDGDRVQVVRDGLVRTRRVTIGARDPQRAQVDGVAAGESVIAVSGTFVRDGDHVAAVAATR